MKYRHKAIGQMQMESETEQLRADLWDDIYKDGPQLVATLAANRQLTSQTVIGLVDHAWFVIENDIVSIAKEE